MSLVEKLAKVLCLVFVAGVLVGTVVVVSGLDREDGRQCACELGNDEALMLAVVDATRALEEAASLIVGSEEHAEIATTLGGLRQALGRIELQSPLSYPLMFDKVRGDYSGGSIENLRGVRLEESHLNELRGLTGDLEKHCESYAASIDLTVFGSSSLLPFREQTERVSDNLNVKAAEARGANVANKLGALVAKAGIPCDIDVRRCVTSEYREIRRPEFAGGDRVYLELQEMVGRTVFIRPTKDARCTNSVLVWSQDPA